MKRKDMNAASRALQALALRKQGEPWDEVARVVGYADKASAYNAVNRLLRSVQHDSVEEYRTLQSQRLDDALRAVYRMALGSTEIDDEGGVIIVKPDLWTLDRYLRIIELQAKLHGVFAEKPVESVTQVLIREIVVPEKGMLDAV
jgi:hypothetical protein